MTILSAITSHPVMAVAGLAGIAAILGAAWHTTRLSVNGLRTGQAALRKTEAATAAVRRPGSLTQDDLLQAMSDATARTAALREDRLSSLTAAAEHETAAVLQGLRLPRPEVTEHLPTMPAAWRG